MALASATDSVSQVSRRGRETKFQARSPFLFFASELSCIADPLVAVQVLAHGYDPSFLRTLFDASHKAAVNSFPTTASALKSQDEQ